MSQKLNKLFPDRELPEIEIKHLITDNRKMLPDAIFVALHGARHNGNDFIRPAVEAGAVAVISDTPQPDISVPVIVVPDPASIVADLAAQIYQTNDSNMNLIGITGTDGKTTITHLIRQVWQQMDPPAGSIGTMGVIYPSHEGFEHTLTTPMAPDLHRELAKMRDHGVSKVVMEVSSHSLDQGRVAGLLYDVGIFTNLTHDHLDYHGTMENYQAAKLKMYRQLKDDGLAVVKADYPMAVKVRETTPAQVIGYRLVDENQVAGLEKVPVATAQITNTVKEGTTFDLNLPAMTLKTGQAMPAQTISVFVPLVGRYNVANTMAAVITMIWYGYDIDGILAGLKAATPVPGRLERVEYGQPFQVIVDFAHTPVGVQSLIEQVRKETTGRVIFLASGAGMRDRVKRRMIAEVAMQMADVVFLTLEEVGWEDPEQIMGDLTAAIPEDKKDSIIMEKIRTEAIRQAINMAEPGDSIILPGMGNYEEMPVSDHIIPYLERKVAEVYLIDRLLREAIENFPN